MGSPDGIRVFDPHAGFFKLIRAKDLPGIQEGGGQGLGPVNVDTVGRKA